MGTLLVSLELFRTTPPDAPVAVDVRDCAMRLVASFALTPGDPHALELAAGEYVVTAALPGGEQLEALGEVPESGSAAIVPLRQRPARPAVSSVTRARGTLRSLPVLLGIRHRLTLWVRERGQWTASTPERLRGGERRVVVTPLVEGPCVLQLSSPLGGSRFSIVPPDTALEVGAQGETGVAAGTAAISFADPLASSLDGYLCEGQTRQAGVLVHDLRALDRAAVDVAPSLLTGYTLLRASEPDGLALWRERMSRPSRVLVADDHVILGWSLLRAGEPRMALAELLRAEAIGPPVYSYGLRLLLDGLQLFAEGSGDAREDAHLASSALARLNRYAATVAWQQRATTFPGRDPGSPLRASRRVDLVRLRLDPVRLRSLRSLGREPGAAAAIPFVLLGVGVAGRRLGSVPAAGRRRPRAAMRRRRRRSGPALLLALAAALVSSEELRQRVLDAIFGSEEDFDYSRGSLSGEGDPERGRYASA